MDAETMTTATVETATKVRVMTGARVEAEMPIYWLDYSVPIPGGRRSRTPEEIAQLLEEKCHAFHDFIRDHRSQDPITLTVVRDYEEQCSACGAAWEVDEDDVACASCGVAVEESAHD